MDKANDLWQYVRVDTLTPDRHDFIKGLVASGIPEKQAEAIAQGLPKKNLDDLVTNRDLQIEIRGLEIRLLKWMIPVLLGQVAVFAAVVKWLGA